MWWYSRNVNNTNIVSGSASKYEAEIVGKNENNMQIINCIINRDEIKTNFINNTMNKVWKIENGTNNGYPILIEMN